MPAVSWTLGVFRGSLTVAEPLAYAVFRGSLCSVCAVDGSSAEVSGQFASRLICAGVINQVASRARASSVGWS